MPFITLKKPDGTSEEIEWTPYKPYKRKYTIKRIQKEPNMNPYSIDDEAIAILTEWYVSRGLTVPPEEIEACRSKPSEPSEQAAPPPAKLEYGTPEFWKDWWKRKKEKEAKAQASAAALLLKAQAEFAALQLKEA